jgi:flagellar motor switch protein FliG
MAASAESKGLENAAILLLSLGQDEAAAILKNLGPKEVQKLGHAMAALKQVPRERVEQADSITIRLRLAPAVARVAVDVVETVRRRLLYADGHPVSSGCAR